MDKNIEGAPSEVRILRCRHKRCCNGNAFFFDYCYANFECWEKTLDYYADVWYNNGRKRIFAESDFRLPDSIHIPSKRAWPQFWPSTELDYVETVWTRASESTVFGLKSTENMRKTRKKSVSFCLGRRCRRFESCHSDHMKIIRTFSYLESRSDYLFYLSILILIVRNENSLRQGFFPIGGLTIRSVQRVFQGQK